MAKINRYKDTDTETALHISDAINDVFCIPCPYMYDRCSGCKVYAIMRMIDEEFGRVNEE